MKMKKGTHVLIRSYSAGVFAGRLVDVCDSGPGRRRVTLDESRRLWSWRAQHGIALSGVATYGIVQDACRVDVPVNGHEIDDVIEIMPTTTKAQETLL